MQEEPGKLTGQGEEDKALPPGGSFKNSGKVELNAKFTSVGTKGETRTELFS